MAKGISSLRVLVPRSTVGGAHARTVEAALSAQAAAVLAPGRLSTKDKLLLLAATCCAHRHHGPAREAVRLAKREGATVPEIEEVLLACFASRGPLVYLAARAALGPLLKERATAQTRTKVSSPQPKSDTLKKFLSYFGTMPLWVESLAETQPALIEGHQMIREIVFADGHAARKLKELVFVAINSADRYDYGIQLHTRASENAGASREEILETIAVSFLEGGIVSWIEGVHHYIGKGERY